MDIYIGPVGGGVKQDESGLRERAGTLIFPTGGLCMKKTMKRAARKAAKTRTATEGISNRLSPKSVGKWLATKEARRPGYVDAVFKAYSAAQSAWASRVAQIEAH
jgi:hypothetical protein